MRFAPSRSRLPSRAFGTTAAVTRPKRPAAAVFASKRANDAVGACMLIAAFLAIALFG